MNQLGPCLDHYMSKCENFLLLCDFNSEMSESLMIVFCAIYNLINLIKEPTCFKNVENPSTIDLILTISIIRKLIRFVICSVLTR